MAETSSTIDLSITSSDSTHRIRHSLSSGEVVRIGRAPEDGLRVPWDNKISREHADLLWDGDRLHIKCVESARNPVVYRSQLGRTLSIFKGERFMIGSTTFAVLRPGEEDVGGALDVEEQFEATTSPDVIEQSFSSQQLHHVSFGNTEQQMELLSGLPEMISASESDEDLAVRLARLLLKALPAADGVAVAHFDESELPQPGSSSWTMPRPVMMRVETRPDFHGRFRPSRRLILSTLTSQQNAMHVWGGDSKSVEYTITEGLGWAFATPIRGEACRGWCLYVSGKGAAGGGLVASDDELKSDLRFTELVAQFIGSVRTVRVLQQEMTQMSTFLSPNVIKNLTGNRDVLTPAERDISVLFCDVRGFSRKAEIMSDNLQDLLRSVSIALGVMANGILDRDGTIADFQGDAALGFWGWPVELEMGPIPACRAALDIHRSFRRGSNDTESMLYGFSVGIGISHGRAIAGQIGTTKQAKVGVFGPMVNQGARLEGLTKQLGVPICIDESTAEWVKQRMPATQARVWRLARVRPKGMDVPMTVFGLLPPEHEYPEVNDSVTMLYDLGLKSVTHGNWVDAIKVLGKIAGEEGPQRFLLEQMERHGNKPPSDWDGAFTLERK